MGRFVILTSCYKPNTASINRLLSFLSAFDSAGIQCKIEMVFAYPDSEFSMVTKAYENINIKYLWECHPISNKYLKYYKSFWDVKGFAKNLKSDDKVFCFGFSQYLSIVVKSAAKVYHERTEHPSIVPVTPTFLQKSYIRACRRLSGMFVISTELKRCFENLGVKSVSIANMIVDSSRFMNLSKREQPYPYIAYCGTALNDKDGVDQLIQAFVLVHKEYADMRLKIIGKAPGTNDISGNVKLAYDLGIKDYVEFTGVIPSTEIPQLLVNATMVALDRPESLQAQCGFPTKLGEYLLSGTPAVVTNVGDIPLFLKDGESALIAQHDNVQAFADKMIWVLDHPDESKAIGEKGKQVALESFNYKIEARKIVDVIFGKE